MIQNLRAKPVVHRVNKVIELPRTIRATLQPNPLVARLHPRVNRAVVQPPKTRTQPLRTNKTPARPTARKSIISTPGNRVPSEASKKKIAVLKDIGRGKILVILGNGPSLVEVDTTQLQNNPKIDIMSINRPDSRIWPTTYWLFCDLSQYKRHNDIWNEYTGTIINTLSIPEKKNSAHIQHLTGEGFSTDMLKGFHIGRSSVYAAMQVALWMNYDRIYIFGIDMCSVTINGQTMMHYYGINPDVNPDSRQKRFATEAKHYDYAARVLSSEDRSRFYFCSSYLRWPFAEQFNRLDHHTAIPQILSELENG